MLAHLRTRTPFLFGLLVLVVGIFAAEHWGLYAAIPHLDKVLHFTGGLAVAWMAMALLQNDLVHLSWPKQLLFIVSVTALVGVLWEFAEYACNGTRHTYPVLYHYFHGGDLADTLEDLVADLSGGTVFALWALYKERN